MAKRKPYEGGDWQIGACTPYRPPATLTAIEAAQRAAEIRSHWKPIAEERAAAGRRWYSGIVTWYERELTELDAVIAAQTAPQKRTARRKAAA